MNRWQRYSMVILVCTVVVSRSGAAKDHVISFGKWISAQWMPGTGEEHEKGLPLRVRALIVDGRVKEYALGATHDVTDRLFVVRRAFRVNDSLPEDSTTHWQWQRGGWLLVDRATGRISPISLPEFDSFYSAASWYRDYVAYCGVSDDGKKVYAIVAQIGRRKPVIQKLLSENGVADQAVPDSACPAPPWQRGPTRVGFGAPGGAKQTFAIRGHAVDVVSEEDEAEEATR